MAITAKWENRDAVMARLRDIVPAAEKQLAVAQMEAGKMLVSRIRPRAPRRRGKYARSLKAMRIADAGKGAQAHLKGISATKDPNAVGLFGLFIWRFLEFGTVKNRAQPHIFPTYRGARKEIRRLMANAVNRAVRGEKAKQAT